MRTFAKVVILAAFTFGAAYGFVTLIRPGLTWLADDYRGEHLPPTIKAELVAQRLYADICPRNQPRSDICKTLFAKVERDYLATH